VEVASHWMRRYGEASIDVDVAPGQTVDVYYAAPFHQWSTGSIGTTPQKRKGTGVLVALLSVVVLLVLVVGVLPNLG
ncbi:hypothetical protein, partial [Auraticoccus cholistanensis]|uniref:hypothetical protein n=1 Tax=Auraticoccus cholistanensis TaxID=2656650 RepID=UPI0018D2740C